MYDVSDNENFISVVSSKSKNNEDNEVDDAMIPKSE